MAEVCALYPLEPYSRRFWRRFFKDATPWARDNIFWGIVVLVVPPWAAYLRDSHPLDWELIKTSLWLYLFAFAVYALVHLSRVPRKLDDDRESRERSLIAIISQKDDAIRSLNDRPKRTAAEQHHYEKAKAALDKLGTDAVKALRHLQTQGKLTFGFYNPQAIPEAMTGEQLHNVYRACAVEGLVSQQEHTGSGERTFEIAPTMVNALNELLYKD